MCVWEYYEVESYDNSNLLQGWTRVGTELTFALRSSMLGQVQGGVCHTKGRQYGLLGFLHMSLLGTPTHFSQAPSISEVTPLINYLL